MPSTANKGKGQIADESSKVPSEMRRLFIQDISGIKKTALQVKANMVMREEEMSSCREQATLFEE